MRAQVEWFAELMEKQLSKNDYKGGWEVSNCSLEYLYLRLMEELGELASIRAGSANGDTVKEAADVANFAMMIADRVAHAVPD